MASGLSGWLSDSQKGGVPGQGIRPQVALVFLEMALNNYQ